MILGLIPKEHPQPELDRLYIQRPKFWAFSIAWHAVFIAIATQIPLGSPESARPIYDQFIRPLRRNALIYRPNKQAEAKSETKVGRSKDARGEKQSPRTIVAAAPNAQSQKQIVWKPLETPKVDVDVPAPNLVARIETAPPPPPPKPQAKAFVAPVLPKELRQAARPEIAANLNSPQVQANAPQQERLNASLPPPPKPQAKQFVAPSARPQAAQAARPEISEDLNLPQAQANAPDPQVAAGTGTTLPRFQAKQFKALPRQQQKQIRQTQVEYSNLPQVQAAVTGPQTQDRLATNLPPPPKQPAKQFVAPTGAGAGQAKQAAATVVTGTLAAATVVTGTLAAAASVDGGRNAGGIPTTAAGLPAPPREALPGPPVKGNDQANIAIAGVNPSPAKQVPNNARSGQFSQAPNTGEPAGGSGSPSALSVPNLTMSEPARPPAAALPKTNTVVYAERVPASASAVFAVPLRPSNRSIPRALDTRFAGRSVYAVVVPIENLPAYGGDWILWFAEVAPQPGQTPAMRAPVPARKLEIVEKGRETKDTRVQVAGRLGKDGRLHDAQLITAVNEEARDRVLEDLASWEFRAATRNGVAIDIDVVFEVPFRLPLRQ